jgi:hypothetical protein
LQAAVGHQYPGQNTQMYRPDHQWRDRDQSSIPVWTGKIVSAWTNHGNVSFINWRNTWKLLWRTSPNLDFLHLWPWDGFFVTFISVPCIRHSVTLLPSCSTVLACIKAYASTGLPKHHFLFLISGSDWSLLSSVTHFFPYFYTSSHFSNLALF